MTGPTPRPDPAGASTALEQAVAIALTTDRDRAVHARAVAAFGLTMGVMAALVWGVAANDLPWAGIIIWVAQVCWIVAIVTVARWREQRSRSTPRHARRTALLGVGASGVLLSAISWAVHLDDAPGVGPVTAVLAGCLVAAPTLVAARRIRSGGAEGTSR